MRLRIFLVCVVLVFLMSACVPSTNVTHADTPPCYGPGIIKEGEADVFNRNFNTDSEQADYIFEQIINALENKDALALKALFSDSTVASIGNFEEDIHTLVNFYEGEMVFYKRYGPGSHAYKEGTTQAKDIFASFDITTNLTKYRLAIRFCAVDSEKPENIGLYSLYIIKAENSDLAFAYWGNDVWNVGINIEDNT